MDSLTRNRSLVLILSAWLALSTGCATILQPGPDQVRIGSYPNGAQVWLDGEAIGKTPMTLDMPRSCDGEIWIDMPGYQRVVINRHKVVAGWVFGNLLAGGIVGLSVDLLTSNQGKYPEDPIYVQLKSATTASQYVAP